MNFPEYLNKIAREASLGAVNTTSSVIQQQINSQQSLNGVMVVQGIVNNTDGSTSLVVAESGSNQQQMVSYLGSSQIYIGKPVFVNNGYVQ